MTPKGCPTEKNLGRFYRLDFKGYPSNQLSGYRLNGRMYYDGNMDCKVSKGGIKK